MNAVVDEWVVKAEEDFRAAQLAIEDAKPLTSVAAFHSQQCAEKYLKGYLTEHKIEFKFMHDLLTLLELIENFDADIKDVATDLDLISDYAVETRYPGFTATLEEGQEAIAAANRVRAFVRGKLGLETSDADSNSESE